MSGFLRMACAKQTLRSIYGSSSPQQQRLKASVRTAQHTVWPCTNLLLVRQTYREAGAHHISTLPCSTQFFVVIYSAACSYVQHDAVIPYTHFSHLGAGACLWSRLDTPSRTCIVVPICCRTPRIFVLPGIPVLGNGLQPWLKAQSTIQDKLARRYAVLPQRDAGPQQQEYEVSAYSGCLFAVFLPSDFLLHGICASSHPRSTHPYFGTQAHEGKEGRQVHNGLSQIGKCNLINSKKNDLFC